MSGLKQQIEKKAVTEEQLYNDIESCYDPHEIDRLLKKVYVPIDVVLGLLADYDIHPKGERVCIPKNKLEEKLSRLKQSETDRDGIIFKWENWVKKLLEESK